MARNWSWGALIAVSLYACGGAKPNPETLPNGEFVATCSESAENCAMIARKYCGDLYLHKLDMKESTRDKTESWTLT
ncbi:MAG TPA: hypothetical protein PKD61_37155, partial [Polyangiaceae bacterium]|nr:hypothetical protein [Polyangiaceae bacterium]